MTLAGNSTLFRAIERKLEDEERRKRVKKKKKKTQDSVERRVDESGRRERAGARKKRGEGTKKIGIDALPESKRRGTRARPYRERGPDINTRTCAALERHKVPRMLERVRTRSLLLVLEVPLENPSGTNK